VKWLCVVVLALAIEGATSARAQTLVPPSLATTVWNELEAAADWGVPYADWQSSRRPDGCEPYAAPADAVTDIGTGGVELWSYRCRQSVSSTNGTWFFYAFDSRDPVVARLEQFRISVEGPPIDQLAAAQAELTSRLNARYGAGERPAARSITEWGSSFWRGALRWQNAELQIYLYIEELAYAKPIVPRLKLQVRHRPVLDSMATVQRLERAQSTLKWGDSGTTLDAQLAKQLGAEFPAAAALLAMPERLVEEQAALLPPLIALLNAARGTGGERHAMLLLAADRLTGRLRDGRLGSRSLDVRRQRLGAYGLHFEWAELGGGWMYTHDLLWRAWQEHPETAWGQQAFVRLLSRGWNTRVGCGDGSDQFRQVIARGEEFLRARPRTSDRAQIVLFLAQSYETWWSLSRASAEREHLPDLDVYQPGAAPAREKAIGYYNELVELPATSDEGAYARLALPRLKLDIDTGQRRFFCQYD
jgi:hypothetical protein